MIAVDIQPYSLTSDIGFQKLIAKLCPNYRIPSIKYFTGNIILDIFMKVKAKIQISLDEISNLSPMIYCVYGANLKSEVLFEKRTLY
jgi:hypothetical protein